MAKNTSKIDTCKYARRFSYIGLYGTVYLFSCRWYLEHIVPPPYMVTEAVEERDCRKCKCWEKKEEKS